MLIFKTRWFARWARKEGIQDATLCKAVEEMIKGLYEANLGGHIFKKRVSRPGHGKRGGFRTIVATNFKDRWFFVYGFAKNEREDIEEDEEAALKELAAQLLSMPPQRLMKANGTGEVTEVSCES